MPQGPASGFVAALVAVGGAFWFWEPLDTLLRDCSDESFSEPAIEPALTVQPETTAYTYSHYIEVLPVEVQTQALGPDDAQQGTSASVGTYFAAGGFSFCLLNLVVRRFWVVRRDAGARQRVAHRVRGHQGAAAW